MWHNELAYVESLINKDIRNNSAWNQRYFVINNTKDTSSPETINAEIKFCQEKIGKVVDNESVWNYLRVFLRNLTTYPKYFFDFCFGLYEKSEDNHSPFLIAFFIDYYETQLNEMIVRNDFDKNEFKGIFDKAFKLLDRLATECDMIREKYWFFIIKKWNEKYSPYMK